MRGLIYIYLIDVTYAFDCSRGRLAHSSVALWLWTSRIKGQIIPSVLSPWHATSTAAEVAARHTTATLHWTTNFRAEMTTDAS